MLFTWSFIEIEQKYIPPESDDCVTGISDPILLTSKELGPLLPDLDSEELMSPRSPEVSVLLVLEGDTDD